MKTASSVVLAFLAGTLQATTLYVPTGAPGIPDGAASTNTIAEALSSLGSTGGEVIVMPGAYPQTATLTIDGPITLRSHSGTPSDTSIIGGGSAAKFCVIKVANAGAVVAGLTVSNGYPSVKTEPGGVWLAGGGMLTNCWVTRNAVVLGGAGGGVLNNNGRVTHCRIFGNVRGGAGNGLGLYQSGADAETAYSEICGNQCTSATAAGILGGGVYSSGGRLHHCIITNNYASLLAGATGSYGGVYLKETTMDHCLIAGNHASSVGGVYLDNGGQTVARPTILRHCTVAGNQAKFGGGLVRAASTTKKCIVENCIVWDNYATFANAVGSTDLDRVADDGIMSVTGLCAHVAIGYRALMADPVFVDPANGDYRLAANSPCRNAGTDENGDPVDLGYVPYDGAAAVAAPGYEPEDVVYVAKDGSKTAPYNSPEAATDDIFAALDYCGDGTVLVVSTGDYAVTREIILDKAITMRSADGPAVTRFTYTGSTDSRLVKIENAGASVAGFTFSGGRYSTDLTLQIGALASISYGTVSNCVFTDGSTQGAANRGGIVANYHGKLYDSLIANCSGGGSGFGGGYYQTGSDAVIAGTSITNCYGSHSSLTGVGAYLEGGLMDRCTIVSNRLSGASTTGCQDALYVTGATVRNTLVAHNRQTNKNCARAGMRRRAPFWKTAPSSPTRLTRPWRPMSQAGSILRPRQRSRPGTTSFTATPATRAPRRRSMRDIAPTT